MTTRVGKPDRPRRGQRNLINRSARRLWKISVITTREAERSVAKLLEEELRQSPCVYIKAESDTATLEVYQNTKPTNWLTNLKVIRERLALIQGTGIRTHPGKISLQAMRNQDWAESWKRHFKPIEIHSKLLIKPSWSRLRVRKKQVCIILDPGLSFGTGQHPTTRFCLEQLVALGDAAPTQSVLDLGTGSGVLALAAAKLGYFPVEAIDIDPEALRVARQNARINGLTRRILYREADVTKIKSSSVNSYSIICANLISNLLFSERDRILSFLKPSGTLILAGILHSEFAKVRRHFLAGGMRMVDDRREQEWHSASFRSVCRVTG